MHALVALLLSASALPLLAQGAPPQTAADKPYAIEYYYKVRWGFQQEFLQLFLKNHYPVLQKQLGGRMVSVKIETPAYHMTEEERWDYRVTIVFKNSTAATTPGSPSEEELAKQLYPDQQTFKREEQRRFEILLAHWDLPITDITPK